MTNAHHLGLSILSAAWLRPPPKADDAALHETLVAFNPMILWESEPSAAENQARPSFYKNIPKNDNEIEK